ncbi:GTPase [Streptomyces sp. AP-93]|uniref:GTPase n=1 Tax=Streptomyces sp. AP-93 TaxID=2929048 RepID=UPI001FAE8077|nr:GTPase domain-containing protein [Streptomyces sp. AP-93]MCJ0872065.1 50S ribosome-binding GTPase [Streptomyces sp. AP-93]
MTAETPPGHRNDGTGAGRGPGAEAGGDWITRIRSAYRAAVGDIAGDLADAVWAEAAGRTEPTVVLFGTQNSGKTTLLRRLLVEDGADVPTWAVVSARKETYQNAEAWSARLRYLDTPGIGAGDSSHAERAAQAVLTADAVLLVLDQVPGGTSEGDLLALVSGRFVDPARPHPFPPGALLLALTKSDDRGRLPGTPGFGELAATLRASVRDKLRAVRSPEPLPAIHFITADPGGMTSDLRTDQLRKAHYATSRDWDGIAGLRDDLAGLAVRTPELRAAAGVRYWSACSRHAIDETRRGLDELGAVIEGGELRRQRYVLLESELEALRGEAVAELRALMGERLRTLPEVLPTDVTDERLSSTALERIAQIARAWDGRWTTKLRRLGQRVEQAQETSRSQPGSQAFLAYADDVAEILARTEDGRAPAAGGSAGRNDQAVWLNLASINAAIQQLTARKVERAHDDALRTAHQQVTAFLDAHRGKGATTRSDQSAASDGHGAPDGRPGPTPSPAEPGRPEWNDQTPASDSGSVRTLDEGSPGGPDTSSAGAPAGSDPPALPTGGHDHFAASLAGPVTQSLTTLYQLWRVHHNEKQDQVRSNEQAALRRRIGTLADDLAAVAETDWLLEADGLAETVKAQQTPDALLAPVRDRHARLTEATDQLEDLLARAPR